MTAAPKRAPVPAWEAFEAACEAASGAELALLHEGRMARWRALKAGLSPLDGVAALHAAGEINDAHAAMLRRAMGGK